MIEAILNTPYVLVVATVYTAALVIANVLGGIGR